MNVLIGCERFGVVREAFRRLGHDAMSCDLVEAADGSPHHYKGDVLSVMENGLWDLAIFHPDCTYVAVSGLHWNKRRPERAALTEQALEFVRKLMACKIPRWAIENPIGCISTRIRKPDQVIQPWQYGEDASKATCLWLKGLPPPGADERATGRSEGEAGESDRQRSEQTRAVTRAGDAARQDVPWDRRCHGSAVEQIL